MTKEPKLYVPFVDYSERIAKLEAENKMLRERLGELKYYAHHNLFCSVRDEPSRDCDCGLVALITDPTMNAAARLLA